MLSRREREVAELVAEGLTNREIADRLVISERTAEGHVEQIRSKLGFHSRTQIAGWVVAQRHAGLVPVTSRPVGAAGAVAVEVPRPIQVEIPRIPVRAFAVGLSALLVIGAVALWPRTAATTLVTVAGLGTAGFSGDGGPATVAQLDRPIGLAFDRAGDLYVADSSFLESGGGGRFDTRTRIRRIDRVGTIRTIAGDGAIQPQVGEFALSIYLRKDTYLAVDSGGDLYIAGTTLLASAPSAGGQTFWVAKLSGGSLGIIAGGSSLVGYSGDGGPALGASLNLPRGLAIDSVGNLFVADSGNGRIRMVSRDGTISTVAGNGDRGFSGDGGPATAATLFAPVGLALSPDGSLYIADTNNQRVRKIDHSGNIVTVAGNGAAGYGGDGGPARDAQLNLPLGLAFDRAGNLYIADSANNRVRMVETSGVIRTVAGDGGAERLLRPSSVAVDPNGVLHIADTGNHRIRKVVRS